MWACPRCPVAAGRLAQSRGNNAITFHVFFPFFPHCGPIELETAYRVYVHTVHKALDVPRLHIRRQTDYTQRGIKKKTKKKRRNIFAGISWFVISCPFFFFKSADTQTRFPDFLMTVKRAQPHKGGMKKVCFFFFFFSRAKNKEKKIAIHNRLLFPFIFFSHRLSFSARIFFKWFCSQRRGRGEGSKIERKVFSYIDFVSFVLLSIPIDMPIESS